MHIIIPLCNLETSKWNIHFINQLLWLMFRTIKGNIKCNKIHHFLSVKTLLKIKLLQVKTFAKWDKFIVNLKGQVYLSSRLLDKILIQFFKLYCNLEQGFAHLSCCLKIYLVERLFLFFAFWLDKANNLTITENNKHILLFEC